MQTIEICRKHILLTEKTIRNFAIGKNIIKNNKKNCHKIGNRFCSSSAKIHVNTFKILLSYLIRVRTRLEFEANLKVKFRIFMFSCACKHQNSEFHL